MPDISPRPVAAGTLQSRITGGVLFLMLALGLYVPNAFDYGLAVLALLAVGWLAGAGLKQQHRLAPLERFFLLAVVVFMAAWYAAWAAHGFPDGGLSMALRLPKLILAVPFYLYLRRVRGIESAWWNGLVAGAIGAGVYALWFSLSGQTGQYGWRVTGPTNPIYFGGLVLAYALMLIPRLADSRQTSLARALAGIAIIMAFVANALSGSRGAWLAIPALAAIYIFTAGARQPLRWRLGLPALIGALSLVVLLNPLLPMSNRFDETLADLKVISSGEDGSGGIGIRLQLWEVAGGLVKQRPWSGSGPGSLELALADEAAENPDRTYLARFDHPHNQYLSALIDGGPALLACLLALLAAPVLLVSPLNRDYSRQCRYLAWCALAAGVVIAVMALSESLFERNAGLVWFAFLSAATTALANRAPG